MTIIISAFLAFETNHCRKYLASLPAAETVGSDSEHALPQLKDARWCTCARFCSAYMDSPSFWDYLRKSCSNSIAVKHQNVQGVGLCQHSLFFLHTIQKMLHTWEPIKQCHVNSHRYVFTVADCESLRLKSSWCAFTQISYTLLSLKEAYFSGEK